MQLKNQVACIYINYVIQKRAKLKKTKEDFIMENASKALIIAGAILLSIAIIGIGMAVFSMANESMSNANLSQQEIDSYNATFMRYEGVQNGSTVKTLLNTIRTHNQTNSNDNSKQIVIKANAELTGAIVSDDGVAGSTSADINTARNAVVAGTRYKVTFNFTSTGLIKEIGYKKAGT